MIPTSKFIWECATRKGLQIPEELETWFLARYEDEPYPDFYTAQSLEDILVMYHDSYWNGTLDVRIPSRYERLKERYEDSKCLIADLMMDIQELEEKLRQCLKQQAE